MPTLEGDQKKLKAAVQRAERERDAAQAVQDYEAEKRAIHANGGYARCVWRKGAPVRERERLGSSGL